MAARFRLVEYYNLPSNIWEYNELSGVLSGSYTYMVSSGAHDRWFSVSSKETRKETSVPEFDGGKFTRHPYMILHLLNGKSAGFKRRLKKKRVINSLNFQPQFRKSIELIIICFWLHRVPPHRQGAAP